MSKDLVPATFSGTDYIAIISLGENTDKVLDDFNLDDKIIPQLHKLVMSIRNTKWEIVLTSSEWGLSLQEASVLVGALNEDLALGNRCNNMVCFGKGFFFM